MKRADRAFTILLGLALGSSAILLALLLTLAPRVEQLLARGAEDTADVVAALVLLLALCGISLGLMTLFRQLAATALLIRRLVAQKVALPPSLLRASEGLDLLLQGVEREELVDHRNDVEACGEVAGDDLAERIALPQVIALVMEHGTELILLEPVDECGR